MFACVHTCVYFERDATLSVVHEKDKDLSIKTTLEKGELVEMRWRIQPGKTKETFSGVIVKVGESEEELSKFATQAHKAVLKGVTPGTQAPQQLFQYSNAKKGCTSSKRERVPTKKIEESNLQEEELSTPKKKKKKSENSRKKDDNNVSAETDDSVRLSTATSLLEQFNKSVAASMSCDANKGTLTNSKKTQPPKEISSEPDTRPPTPPSKETESKTRPCPSPSKEIQHHSDSETQPPSPPSEEKEVRLPLESETRPPSKQTVPSISKEIKDPLSETQHPPPQIKAVERPIGLTETWWTCNNALDALRHNEMDLPITVTPTIMSTLRGIASPEFTDFLQRLAAHMESETCPHTCLKLVNNQHVPIHDSQQAGGFLSELQDTSSLHTSMPQNTVFPREHEVQSTSRTLQNLSNADSSDDGFLTMMWSSSHQATSSKTIEEKKELPRKSSPRKPAPKHASPKPPVSSSKPSDASPKPPVASPTSPAGTDEELPLIRRTSPRKPASKFASPKPLVDSPKPSVASPKPTVASPTSPAGTDEVKLLPNTTLSVNRHRLRKICLQAAKKKHKAAEVLMYGLLGEAFSLEEMASSRGLGLSKPKPEDAGRPVLDETKINVLKEYVHSWCKKNTGTTFPDKDLNRAVTERNSYARKQMKKTSRSLE